MKISILVRHLAERNLYVLMVNKFTEIQMLKLSIHTKLFIYEPRSNLVLLKISFWNMRNLDKINSTYKMRSLTKERMEISCLQITFSNLIFRISSIFGYAKIQIFTKDRIRKINKMKTTRQEVRCIIIIKKNRLLRKKKIIFENLHT
jgi:hypothetical protein